MNAELGEEGSVAGGLLREAASGRLDDRTKFRQSARKLLINNNIFKLRGVRDFTTGGQQTARDHVRIVLSALLEALLEGIDRRRQDEDADRAGELFLDLLRALPVDFQQDVRAGSDLFGDLQARGAVVIAVDFG